MWMVLLRAAVWLAVAASVVVAASILALAAALRCRRATALRRGAGVAIGVFHPYCHAGGGGERVLWVALQALQQRVCTDASRRAVVHVYTGDVEASRADILGRAKSRFFVDVGAGGGGGGHLDVQFVYIAWRRFMEAARYPRFTMLGQSVGTMVIAVECLWRQPAHLFLDTTGCAFTYLVAKLAGCAVASYTHYPTITQDMLNRVHERRPTYNNDADIAASTSLTHVKLAYYRVFAAVYRLVGRLTDVNMVNSNWTRAHIDALWRRGAPAVVVFPPCNTEELQRAPLGGRRRVVVSVGQFRPEKDHARQVAAFAELKHRDERRFADVTLVLVGGARDDEDRARVQALRDLAGRLGVADAVDIRVNAPFAELKQLLSTSLMGLHSMWNEHFGIGVVEMMAAGVVPVAHNSGGPKADIVVPAAPAPGHVGYLAHTPAEYADAMEAVLDTPPDDFAQQVQRARASVRRFSDTEFSKAFVAAMLPVLEPLLVKHNPSSKAKSQ